MKKILPKDRIRSEKGAGKQAKRWRNTGHERAPANQLAEEREDSKPVARARRGVKKAAGSPP